MTQRKNDIVYIAVPFRSGANREGAQYAPKWLMENLSVPEEACSILQFPTEDIPLVDTESNGVKNYSAVLRMISGVSAEVVSALADHQKVVALGGDHSITMGTLAGVLKSYPNIGVIWFDAHTDINTEESSPSGNAHGMPLAALMGLCKSEINNKGTKLNPANIFWVGARDIDEGEWEIIKRLRIDDHVYTSEMVHQMGMNAVMNEIRERLKTNGINQLHLSFDIDVMDPLIVSATDTPVLHGLNDIECDAFIEELSSDMPPIVSLDFVEYNPLMEDELHATGKWCIRILKAIVSLK